MIIKRYDVKVRGIFKYLRKCKKVKRSEIKPKLAFLCTIIELNVRKIYFMFLKFRLIPLSFSRYNQSYNTTYYKLYSLCYQANFKVMLLLANMEKSLKSDK